MSIVMSGVEELAVTMLALAILMYLLCKWGVFKCCSSRQAQLTTVPSAPNQQAPTLALEVALVRNQTLQCTGDAAHANATVENPAGSIRAM